MDGAMLNSALLLMMYRNNILLLDFVFVYERKFVCNRAV